MVMGKKRRERVTGKAAFVQINRKFRKFEMSYYAVIGVINHLTVVEADWGYTYCFSMQVCLWTKSLKN